jgi:hypothetical protein
VAWRCLEVERAMGIENIALAREESFRIIELQEHISAACDYCVKNGATPANAS